MHKAHFELNVSDMYQVSFKCPLTIAKNALFSKFVLKNIAGI